VDFSIRDWPLRYSRSKTLTRIQSVSCLHKRNRGPTARPRIVLFFRLVWATNTKLAEGMKLNCRRTKGCRLKRSEREIPLRHGIPNQHLSIQNDAGMSSVS
jgi:hypothetical protein